MNLFRLQVEVGEWSQRNFGDQPSYRPLLGVVEEVGELSHAHLKHEQGIRGMDDQLAKAAKVDAVADIIVYLADYCHRSEIDLDKAVTETWEKVSRRNWKDNPSNATEVAGE